MTPNPTPTRAKTASTCPASGPSTAAAGWRGLAERACGPMRKETQQAYADVANTIARFEPVKMLAPTHKLEAARALLNDGVEIFEMVDRRLLGAGLGTQLSRSTLRVNSRDRPGSSTPGGDKYGSLRPGRPDGIAHPRTRGRSGIPIQTRRRRRRRHGGRRRDGHHDRTCFLNQNRNPNWTRAEVEAELCRTLGAEKVIWIPGDVMRHGDRWAHRRNRRVHRAGAGTRRSQPGHHRSAL